MNKQEEFFFYVYNIRLLTDRERRPATYKRLFQKLYRGYRLEPVRKRCCYMMLGSMEECHIAGTPVLKGYLGRFSEKGSNAWNNFGRCDIEKELGDETACPDFQLTEYLFIPTLHRLCLLMHPNNISLAVVQQFLETALNRAANRDEQVQVTLEKSREFLQDILDARDILDIKLHVSFSNQDLNDEYTTLVDKQLRDAEIEHLEISGRARDGKSMNLKKSDFLMGAAGLVPSNGHALVQIVNSNGEKETVDTTNYPRTFRICCEQGAKAEAIVHHMMKTYPQRNEA
jgi:hypothetical protein